MSLPEHIFRAGIQDIDTIQEIAYQTWPVTYGNIISQEQIDFMLQKFYSYEYLLPQIANKEHLFLLYKVNEAIAGYSHCLPSDKVGYYHLSKIYILPQFQGMRIGQQLLNCSEQTLRESGVIGMRLNVNRHNNAQHFYSRNGYTIIETVDIPLDKFWLNDYVMEKNFGNVEFIHVTD